MHTFLDEPKLMKLVPSVFSRHGSNETSESYSHIPTIEVLRGLNQHGFYPVKAMQSKTRSEDKKDFVKHILRLRHVDSQPTNGLFPEIVMVNSHDGKSSYQLRAGVYRLVCSNGMIAGDECYRSRVVHKGDVIGKVCEAANELIQIVPQSVSRAIEWEGKQLSADAKQVFAESAMLLRWDEEDSQIKPAQLLYPRRQADCKNDLWTTLNVVQENLIRGRIRYRTKDNQRQSTRAVNSVNENVRLNTALWTLTEKMASLI